jgi:hypothetical protein
VEGFKLTDELAKQKLTLQVLLQDAAASIVCFLAVQYRCSNISTFLGDCLVQQQQQQQQRVCQLGWQQRGHAASMHGK